MFTPYVCIIHTKSVVEALRTVTSVRVSQHANVHSMPTAGRKRSLKLKKIHQLSLYECTVVFVVCVIFEASTFKGPIHLHYMKSEFIFLKISVCVPQKKESRIHLG